MIGRTPGNIIAIRPMKDGVIADFDITQSMLKHFIKGLSETVHIQTEGNSLRAFGVTEVEKGLWREAAEQAGAKEAYLIEEPMAAAIGSELPVAEPREQYDSGYRRGTTEVAIISLGGIVTSRSIRIGGDER